MRLYCLTHSGGAARIFRGWRPYLRRGVTLHPLDRAGLGERTGQPPYRTFADAVSDLVARLAGAARDEPYTIYGHSLGGLLGYEALGPLAALGAPLPRWLFVGGCRPPHLGRRHPMIHNLPDREFLTALGRLGGVPPELLADDQAVAYYAPLIRADHRIYETYQFRAPARKPAVSLVAFVGTADPVTSPEETRHWTDLVAGPVHGHTLAGAGHFPVEDRTVEIVEVINRALGHRTGPAAPNGRTPAGPDAGHRASAT